MSIHGQAPLDPIKQQVNKVSNAFQEGANMVAKAMLEVLKSMMVFASHQEKKEAGVVNMTPAQMKGLQKGEEVKQKANNVMDAVHEGNSLGLTPAAPTSAAPTSSQVPEPTTPAFRH